MDEKKKEFIVPEAEVVILFDVNTDVIVASAGVNGWGDDDGTEVFGK